MKYIFTVVATSWLRYSRQLERMLLSVIARSVMLLRDLRISQHNLNFEATNVLLIFPIRNVRQQITRRCLFWFHKNEPPKYILIALGNWSHTQSTNVDLWNKKLYIFLRWSSSEKLVDCIEYRLTFKTLMSH